MTTTPALFYIFSAVMLFAAFRVITARSPVYAALYLVLSFFSAACVWMLLRAEFLSIALILVYVGAVMVLFLFVVMMLDINTDTLRENNNTPASGRRGRGVKVPGACANAHLVSAGDLARASFLDEHGPRRSNRIVGAHRRRRLDGQPHPVRLHGERPRRTLLNFLRCLR